MVLPLRSVKPTDTALRPTRSTAWPTPPRRPRRGPRPPAGQGPRGGLDTRPLDTLLPQAAEQTPATAGEVRDALDASAAELRSLLRPLEDEIDDPAEIAGAFFRSLPEIHRQLMIDATALERGDPAAESVDEVIVAYPGFLAIAVHRVAHRFTELGVPLLPRVLTEWAHERTGIDIHPGATLGHPVIIDHGTGIVIGETAVIGNNVKLYQER